MQTTLKASKHAGKQVRSDPAGKEMKEHKVSRNAVDHFMNANQLRDR